MGERGRRGWWDNLKDLMNCGSKIKRLKSSWKEDFQEKIIQGERIKLKSEWKIV